MRFENYNQFKRGAAGRSCKLVKSERLMTAFPEPVWMDDTAGHKMFCVVRTIKAVRSSDIVFTLPDGRESFACVNSAKNYSPTETGFVLEQPFQGPQVIGGRLTYEWV